MTIDFAVGMFIGGALTLVLGLGLVMLTKLVYGRQTVSTGGQSDEVPNG